MPRNTSPMPIGVGKLGANVTGDESLATRGAKSAIPGAMDFSPELRVLGGGSPQRERSKELSMGHYAQLDIIPPKLWD